MAEALLATEAFSATAAFLASMTETSLASMMGVPTGTENGIGLG